MQTKIDVEAIGEVRDPGVRMVAGSLDTGEHCDSNRKISATWRSGGGAYSDLDKTRTSENGGWVVRIDPHYFEQATIYIRVAATKECSKDRVPVEP